MARITGVNLPVNKRLIIGLTYIYGIGITNAEKICKNTGININKKIRDLEDSELIKLRNEIEQNYKVESDLRKEINLNIKRKKDIKCYQGLRHIRKLPVRGQNTHSNARTRKGKAIAIAGKKKAVK